MIFVGYSPSFRFTTETKTDEPQEMWVHQSAPFWIAIAEIIGQLDFPNLPHLLWQPGDSWLTAPYHGGDLKHQLFIAQIGGLSIEVSLVRKKYVHQKVQIDNGFNKLIKFYPDSCYPKGLQARGIFTEIGVWRLVKTLYPCSSHQEWPAAVTWKLIPQSYPAMV